MKYFIYSAALLLSLSFLSCEDTRERKTIQEDDAPEKELEKPLSNIEIQLQERVMTREEQEQLKPETVVKSLKDGNSRFLDNQLTARNHSEQVRNSVAGQYPKAVILSCLDSRVPVEDVFDKGIGDLFVARVAGNFVNEDILGSMEFGCNVAGAKVIMVLGHQNCGAVRAAIDNVTLGNIVSLVRNIRPAVDMSDDYEGEQTSENLAYVKHVGVKNVLNTVNRIRSESEILRKMEEDGEIKIIGAMYHMGNGEVEFYEQ